MKNMDKELTVPKWVLIVQPKIPHMPQNLSAQFVYPRPKVLDFNEKRLHWASVVRAPNHWKCIKTIRLMKKIKAIVELGLFLDLLINSCEFSMDCMRR